jgi:hypothetical protein
MESWRRDTLRLFVRYLVVGACFVPAGALYAYFSMTGPSSLWMTLLCLVVGLIPASFVWQLLHQRSVLHSPSQNVFVIVNGRALNLTTQASVSIFLLWYANQPAPLALCDLNRPAPLLGTNTSLHILA